MAPWAIPRIRPACKQFVLPVVVLSTSIQTDDYPFRGTIRTPGLEYSDMISGGLESPGTFTRQWLAQQVPYPAQFVSTRSSLVRTKAPPSQYFSFLLLFCSLFICLTLSLYMSCSLFICLALSLYVVLSLSLCRALSLYVVHIRLPTWKGELISAEPIFLLSAVWARRWLSLPIKPWRVVLTPYTNSLVRGDRGI